MFAGRRGLKEALLIWRKILSLDGKQHADQNITDDCGACALVLVPQLVLLEAGREKATFSHGTES